MLNVNILVGTMTGTAQLVAQEIELACADAQTGIDVTFMDALDRRVFERPGVFLICTSTYGQGDVPDNARPSTPISPRAASRWPTCITACLRSATALTSAPTVSAAGVSTKRWRRGGHGASAK
jgi:flavodoxin